MKVRHIRTSISGWYDAEWLAENNVVPEAGALIRSRVPVTSRKITQQLTDEELRIGNLYPEKALRIFVVPKIVDEKSTDLVLSGGTDRERVENYVALSLPEAARFTAKRAVKYLAGCLSGIAPGASQGAIRFISLEGQNVLSFRQIEIRYAKQGLILLKGKNRDWKGGGDKSNGAGKTNALSLLPVAMFGESGKGQRHDSWAREHTKKPAALKLRIVDSRKRKIVISRGRRPKSEGLTIDGGDATAGISGIGKNQTQGRIEHETGFTLKMLTNSVYIDQTVANGFLFGAQKEKMDLVSRIQDLDRYTEALKITANDITNDLSEKSKLEAAILRSEEELERLRKERTELKEQQSEETVWAGQSKAAKKKFQIALAVYQGLKSSERVTEEKRGELDEARRTAEAVHKSLNKAQAAEEKAEVEIRKTEQLMKAGRCPVCTQPVKKIAALILKNIVMPDSGISEKLAKQEEREDVKAERLERYIADYEAGLRAAEFDLALSREAVETIKTAAEEERKRREKTAEKEQLILQKIRTVKTGMKSDQEALRELDERLELLYYAQKSFHRSGMPLHLCGGMCGHLNKAAEEYAELFWGGRIQVRFGIEDQEMVTQIVNPDGSGALKGQSVGESAMAGLVCAFAMRDISPKTNLLILDEPGHGLDPEGQAEFARGLLKLRDSGRYETIILTTHSVVIQSILEGEAKIWEVRKRKRKSQLVTN